MTSLFNFAVSIAEVVGDSHAQSSGSGKDLPLVSLFNGINHYPNVTHQTCYAVNWDDWRVLPQMNPVAVQLHVEVMLMAPTSSFLNSSKTSGNLFGCILVIEDAFRKQEAFLTAGNKDKTQLKAEPECLQLRTTQGEGK